MQFRSSTPDLHNFYNSFLQKNRALNALFLLFPPACVPYLYTREAYTPSGYTLRLRLYTRSKAYTEANANSGHTASPMGSGKGISSSPSFSLTRRGPDGA